jgi:hypothetical protein
VSTIIVGAATAPGNTRQPRIEITVPRRPRG